MRVNWQSSKNDRRSSTGLFPLLSATIQAINGRGKLPQGSLLLIPALIPSVYGPLTLFYRSRLPGLARGSEHNTSIRAMKPLSGSASLAPTNWFT